jgi:hypothetical protein
LVGVTKENYQWKSTDRDSNRIDILPNDPFLPDEDVLEEENDETFDKNGNITRFSSYKSSSPKVFIIGVLGQADDDFPFEICVSFDTPIEIKSINLSQTNEINQRLSVLPDKYSYFCIPIEPSNRDELIVIISCNSTFISRKNEEIFAEMSKKNDLFEKHVVDLTYGRAVYTSDTFALYGALDGSNNLFSNQFQDDNESAVFPIVYISQNCKYPTAENFTWRVIFFNDFLV